MRNGEWGIIFPHSSFLFSHSTFHIPLSSLHISLSTKTMNTEKRRLPNVILYGSLLTFTAFVVYILYINQEVLYTAHDRSEFIYGEPFFHTLLQKPFGLMQYAGAWLTQLFFHPALGAVVLVALWALIFFVGIKAFRLQEKTAGSLDGAAALMLLPVACLLTSVVDLGYWIYIYTIRGYWFSQTVAYLLMLLLLWAARLSPRKWHLAWYLAGAFAFPVLGWFSLLFILCLIFTEKPSWRELTGLVVLLFTPGIWHTQLYSNLNASDVMLAGLPRFVTPSDVTERLSIPFLALGAVPLLLPLLARYLSRWFTPLVCAAAGIFFTVSLMFSDDNYLSEMRMVRYAEDDNWKGVLSVAQESPRPTTTMIFLKNVALMNEGGLLDRAFKIGNVSHPIHNPDTLHVTLLDIASPLVYYNYGMINEAIRLSFENGIQAGFSPFYLKMLARCALAAGDKALLARYSTLLHHLMFYGQWAPSPVTPVISALSKAYPDEITGVENSDSYIVNSMSLWYQSDSKVASEQALFYAMIRRDPRRFWPSLRQYAKMHMNEAFPLHAQEAYILFVDKAPEAKRMMMPVEEAVYNRYKQFWTDLQHRIKPGKTLGAVADEMRAKWGDTYWFYNLFGTRYSSAVRSHSAVQS